MSLPPELPELESDGSRSPPTEPDSGGLFRRYTVLLGADVASRGLRFLADLVLVRHFGPMVFGQLNLAQSLAVQGMGVANCGLDTAGMRDVAADPAATQSIAATVIRLRFLMGLVTWGILGVLTWSVPQYRDCFELTAVFGLSMFTGSLTMGWVAQARGHLSIVGLSMLTTHLLFLGGVQLAVRSGWPAVSVPMVMVASELLSAAGLWVWFCRSFGAVTRPLPLRAALKFLGESAPIGGANILRGLTVGSDIILSGLFVSESEVGLYSGAFKLYSLGLSLIALYCAVLLPQLAECAARTLVAARSALRSSLRRTSLASVPLVLVALLAAGTALELLFGPDFGAATPALRVLVLALPANLVAGHYRTLLVALGRQRYDLRLVAIGAVVHVGMKLLLIPQFGITGAAWGTFAGEAALMLLSWRVVNAVLDRPVESP